MHVQAHSLLTQMLFACAIHRLHSAGHAMDAAVRNAGFTQLKPAKGYHFSDGPYVEYSGALDAADKDSFVDRVNAQLQQIIAAGISTSTSTDAATGMRIVSVANCECPCGGTHVQSTSELQGTAVTKIKAKKGNQRVSYSITDSQ
jgi:Ser-tRNA(Ala) deacylase AlaX